MSAGNSDFSGLVQGGLGQGFAQGTEKGIDAYQRQKKLQEDAEQRKFDNKLATDANARAATEQTMKYTGGVIADIKQFMDTPVDLSKATPDEINDRNAQLAARLERLKGLTATIDKAFSASGISITGDEYITAIFGENPAEFAKKQGERSINQLSYANMRPRIEALSNAYAEIVSKQPADSDAAKNALKEYETYINTPDPTTGLVPSQVYEKATGQKFVSPLVDMGKLYGNVRVNAINKNVLDRAADLASKGDPLMASILQNPNATSKDLITLPDGTTTTLLDYVNSAVKFDEIKTMVNSGDAKRMAQAMDIIFTMSDAQKKQLPPDVADAWKTFNDYKNGTVKADDSIYSKAVIESATPRVEFQTKEADLENKGLATILTKLNIKVTNNDQVTKYFELAAKGINVNTPANKLAFASFMPEGTSQADIDAAWAEGVEKPLQKSAQRDELNYRALENQVTAGTLANINTTSELVTSGGLFLTATNESGETVFSSQAYQLFANARGGDSTAVRTQFQFLVNESKKAYETLDETRRNSLQEGRNRVIISNVDAENAADFAGLEKRLRTANATSAENAAEVSTKTKGSQISITNSQATLLEIQTTVEKASKVGKVAQTFSDTAKLLGTDWLNSDGPEKAFGAFMTPAQIAAARKVAGVTISMAEQGRNLDILNEYLKNPEIWFKQPDTLRKVATQAGINPENFVVTVRDLATRSQKLSEAQLSQIKTNIWATQQGVNLDQEQLELSKLRRQDDVAATTFSQNMAILNYNAGRTDANRNYAAGRDDESFRRYMSREELALRKSGQAFDQNMATRRYDFDAYWRNKEFNVGEAQRDINNMISLVSLQQKGQELSNNQEAAVMQFKSTTLPAIMAAEANAKTQISQAVEGQKMLVKDNQWLNDLATKIDFKTKPGSYILPNGLTPGQKTVLGKYAELQLEVDAAKVAQKNSATLINGAIAQMQGAGVNPNDVFPDTPFQSGGTIPLPKNGNLKNVTKALQNYNPATASGKAMQAGIVQILQGTANGGEEIYTPGWCGRPVKTLIKQYFNLPPGVNVDQNAVGIYNNLKKQGWGVNNNKPITDVSQLKDGMILWQNTNDFDPQGNRIGHIAIYNGGKIWQNTTNPANNNLSGAYGYMDAKEWLAARGIQTYGVMIPDKYAKEGYQRSTQTTGTATSTAKKPGDTTSTSQPGRVAYAGTSGQFQYSFDLAKATRSGKTVNNTSPYGPLTVYSEGKYRVLNSSTTAVVLNNIGPQAVQYFNSLAKSEGQSIDFRALAKKDPNLAVKTLADILKTPTAGKPAMAGDVDRVVRNWLKARGIIK